MLRRDAHHGHSTPQNVATGRDGRRSAIFMRGQPQCAITLHPATEAEPSSSTGAGQQPNYSHWQDLSTAAVVAYGDSGVGKSALVIGAATGATSSAPDTTQALCINLRHLPTTSSGTRVSLGAPLITLLAELSAPQRLLVIDGADAISEGLLEPSSGISRRSPQADVTIIAVTANDTRQLVRDTVAECSRRGCHRLSRAATDGP